MIYSLQPVVLLNFVVVLAAVLAVGHSAANSYNAGHEDADADWVQFKKDHGKAYKNANDEQVHKTAFNKTHQLVRQHNAEYAKGQHSFDMAINHLSDLTPEEYRVRLGFRPTQSGASASSSSPSGFMPHTSDASSLPNQVDWRQQGYVTAVKNQGSCGSCWSFATTGALEGQHKRATGQLISLSEQNLVDCSANQGHSCQWGSMDSSYQYIQNNHGVDTESSYPYTGGVGTCRFNTANVGATTKGWYNLPNGNEQAMQSAVATQGPIAICIDSDHSSFQNYKSGVYYEPQCSTNSNHCLLTVGYGTDPNYGDYWLVKNSWGTGWGEAGYIRMARNRNNNCGVAQYPSYPLV